MSATLWLDYEKGRALEFGSTVRLYQAFAELAQYVGDGYLEEYPALFAVCHQVESNSDADAAWYRDVRREAKAVLKKFGQELSQAALEVLQILEKGDDGEA